MVYAVIDPRDGHEIEYFSTREAANDYARWLERSNCHPYFEIKLTVRAINA